MHKIKAHRATLCEKTDPNGRQFVGDETKGFKSVISSSRREVDANCALLGHYAQSSGNFFFFFFFFFFFSFYFKIIMPVFLL